MRCRYLYSLLSHDAGWSSTVARRAHNPKVVGSNPAPATRKNSEGYDENRNPLFVFLPPGVSSALALDSLLLGESRRSIIKGDLQMAQDRIKSSKYTGVYVRITTDPRRRHNGKPDKTYEYMYRDADGKQRAITAGWASDGYSEQEASSPSFCQRPYRTPDRFYETSLRIPQRAGLDVSADVCIINSVSLLFVDSLLRHQIEMLEPGIADCIDDCHKSADF